MIYQTIKIFFYLFIKIIYYLQFNHIPKNIFFNFFNLTGNINLFFHSVVYSHEPVQYFLLILTLPIYDFLVQISSVSQFNYFKTNLMIK